MYGWRIEPAVSLGTEGKRMYGWRVEPAVSLGRERKQMYGWRVEQFPKLVSFSPTGVSQQLRLTTSAFQNRVGDWRFQDQNN